MIEVSLKDNQYPVTRPKLQKWLSMEKIRNDIIESAGRKDKKVVDNLFSYLSALLDVSDIDDAPWYEVIEAYYISSIECAPRLDLSIILSGRKKERRGELPDPWDYDERVWYSWVHMLAGNYSWTLEYISELDVDDALALIQEISLQDQFNREWEWGLSEVAYEYEKSTKKSKLRKLERPSWMRQANIRYKQAVEEQKPTVRVNPAFIPPGVILLDGQNQTTINKGDSNTA